MIPLFLHGGLLEISNISDKSFSGIFFYSFSVREFYYGYFEIDIKF